jgi:hypothetical protein
MKMREYFSLRSFVCASSSSNVSRTGSGGVGLLGPNAKSFLSTKVSQYFTPQKRVGQEDEAETSCMGSLTERVCDSDGDESSTDDHQPKKKEANIPRKIRYNHAKSLKSSTKNSKRIHPQVLTYTHISKLYTVACKKYSIHGDDHKKYGFVEE